MRRIGYVIIVVAVFLVAIYVKPSIAYTPSDPLFVQQWAHATAQAEAGWDITRGDPNIVIAVIDTGVDYTHEDLVNNIWHDSDGNLGKDFVNINTSYYTDRGYAVVSGEDYTVIDNDPADISGHGTHCAGIVAAENNGIGVVGVAAGCKIMSLRAGFIMKSGDSIAELFSDDAVSLAITYAVDNGAHIICLSLPISSESCKNACDYAYENGVIVVAAAGDNDSEQKLYPAAYDNVIAVSATNNADQKTWFSNYGDWTDIAAPGYSMLSTVPLSVDPSGYKELSGTAMSCSYAAGVLGLVLSFHSELIPSAEGLAPAERKQRLDKIIQTLQHGADMPLSGQYIGAGRVNIDKTLRSNISSAVAEISSPENNQVIQGAVHIAGSATGENYTVFQGRGIYPKEWSFINAGGRIVNQILAAWDTETVEEDLYTLKLRTEDFDGYAEDYLRVYCAKGLHVGWPKKITEIFNRPINVGDIDGDGTLEIIASIGNTVYAWKHDGSTAANWPKTIEEGAREAPACGDINNDGKDEIIVSSKQKIYAFKGDGSLLSGWPVTTDCFELYTPTLSDINNDGFLDVIVGGGNYYQAGKLHVFSYDGRLVGGWPQTVDINREYYPTVGDLDGDGHKEIICSGQSFIPDRYTSYLYVFNNDGTLRWKKENENGFSAFSVLGDFNNDRKLEICIVDKDLTLPLNYGRIQIIDHAGSVISQFGSDSIGPAIENSIYKPLALFDCNNDYIPEIVLSGYFFVVWDKNGNVQGNWPFVSDDAFLSSPIIGDTTGDGEADLIGVTAGASVFEPRLHEFDLKGNLLRVWPKNKSFIPDYPGSGSINTPIIADIDGDNNVELVLARGNMVCVWDINIPYDPQAMHWPMFQHDSQHTGNYGIRNKLPVISVITNPRILRNMIRGISPLTIHFDASRSFDPDGDNNLLRFFWDFDDGTFAEGSVADHTFYVTEEQSKTFQVMLTVVDQAGGRARKIVQVTAIRDVNPPAKPEIISAIPFVPGTTREEDVDLKQGVELTWKISKEAKLSPNDPSVVAGYEIYRDEKLIKTVTEGPAIIPARLVFNGTRYVYQSTFKGYRYEDEKLKGKTTYTYKVIAYDAAGNKSEPDTITVKTFPDVFERAVRGNQDNGLWWYVKEERMFSPERPILVMIHGLAFGGNINFKDNIAGKTENTEFTNWNTSYFNWSGPYNDFINGYSYWSILIL